MNPRIHQILEAPIIFCSTQSAESAILEKSTILKEIGVAGKIWTTKSGTLVVAETGKVKGKLSRKFIKNLTDERLAEFKKNTPCTLANFYTKFQDTDNLFLELAEPPSQKVGSEIVEKVAIDAPAGTQLWLCYKDLEFLKEIKAKNVSLVHKTKLSLLSKGLEIHVKDLSEANINAICLDKDEFSPGVVTQLHRFGVCCFALGADLMRDGIELLDMGIDGIYGNNPEILLAARDEIYLK